MTPGVDLEESTFKITVIRHLKQIQLGASMSNAHQVKVNFNFISSLFKQFESPFFTSFLLPHQVCYLVNLALTTKTGSWRRFAEYQRSCSAQSAAFCCLPQQEVTENFQFLSKIEKKNRKGAEPSEKRNMATSEYLSVELIVRRRSCTVKFSKCGNNLKYNKVLQQVKYLFPQQFTLLTVHPF